MLFLFYFCPYSWNTNPRESTRIACLYTAHFTAYRGEPRHADALAVGSGILGLFSPPEPTAKASATVRQFRDKRNKTDAFRGRD